MAERRKDSKKRVLKEGEYQRSNGTYEYRWRSENGKRNNVYAKVWKNFVRKKQKFSVTAVMAFVRKRGTRPSMTFTSSGCN